MTMPVKILTFIVCSISLLGQDTAGTGTIIGVMRDDQGRPTSGVRACVAASERFANTPENGTFRLPDLRPGVHQLEVYVSVTSTMLSGDVEVRAGLEATIEIVLPNLNAGVQSVTVTDAVFIEPEEIKNSGFLIQSREIYQSARALQDVSRYVQSLPGVAIGAADFRNDIIVRGGSPLENLFIVDNIEVPNINTFANFASAGGTVGIKDCAGCGTTIWPTASAHSAKVISAMCSLCPPRTQTSRCRTENPWIWSKQNAPWLNFPESVEM